jgi:hypothetical protein
MPLDDLTAWRAAAYPASSASPSEGGRPADTAEGPNSRAGGAWRNTIMWQDTPSGLRMIALVGSTE